MGFAVATLLVKAQTQRPGRQRPAGCTGKLWVAMHTHAQVMHCKDTNTYTYDVCHPLAALCERDGSGPRCWFTPSHEPAGQGKTHKLVRRRARSARRCRNKAAPCAQGLMSRALGSPAGHVSSSACLRRAQQQLLGKVPYRSKSRPSSSVDHVQRHLVLRAALERHCAMELRKVEDGLP